MTAFGRVLDTLQTLVPVEQLSDGEHLQRFVNHHDEAAFTELVRRHGPMVYGVSRRIMRNGTDADDVFQATFLVLACKASSIRTTGHVRAWLYGVAVRIAHRARQQAQRRQARLAKVVPVPQSATPLPHDDLWPILDAELANLAEPLRQVFLLCDVEGRSRSQAAKELAWPEGTVAKRLAKVRHVLAQRLTRRGITLSVPAVAVLLQEASQATVPTHAMDGLPQRALAFAHGNTQATLAHTLANDCLRRVRLSVATAVAGIGLLLLLGGGFMFAGGPSEPPPPKSPPPSVTPKEPEPVAVPWKVRETLSFNQWLPGSLAYSDDGKYLAVGGTDGNVSLHDAQRFGVVWATQRESRFAAVAFHNAMNALAVTQAQGIAFLDRAQGKLMLELGLAERDVHPITVAEMTPLPDLAGVTGKPRRVVVGSGRGYTIAYWRDHNLETLGTINSLVAPKGQAIADAEAVPLAADPSGRCVISTGPLDPTTQRNVLWAYVAGDYSKESPGNRLMPGHEARVVCAAWAKQSPIAITGDATGRLLVWDTKTMKERQRHELGGRIVAVALSPDGTQLAVSVVQDRRGVLNAYLQEVYVWPTANPPKTLKPIVTEMQQQFGPLRASLAFHPDGKQLAYCFANPLHLLGEVKVKGHVHILDATDKPPEVPLKGSWEREPMISDPEFDLRALAVNPTGTQFAIQTTANRTLVYDLATRERLYRVNGQGPRFMEKNLLTWDARLAEYDATTGREKNTYPPEKQIARRDLVAIAPDGRRVVVYDGLEVEIHTANAKIPAVRLEGVQNDAEHRQPGFNAHGLAWSPDGQRIAGFFPRSPMGVLWFAVWDARTGKRLAKLEPSPTQWNSGTACFAWSPDGKHLVVGGLESTEQEHSNLAWLDATTLKVLRSIKVRSRDTGADVTALAVAPDGRTVAAAVHNHSGKGPLVRVRLWDTTTDELGETFLPEHDSPIITNLAWSPNQRVLLAATGLQLTPVVANEMLHRVQIWRWRPD